MLNKRETNLISHYHKIVSEVLRPYNIDMCLIGGWAVKHYANPPATLDFDFLCGEKLFDVVRDRFEFSNIYPLLKFKGFDIKVTEEENLIRMMGFPILWLKKNNIRVDLFYADTSFRKSVINRAKNITGTNIKVASLVDILTFKTINDRAKDRKHFNLLTKQYNLTEKELSSIADNANNEMTERG